MSLRKLKEAALHTEQPVRIPGLPVAQPDALVGQEISFEKDDRKDGQNDRGDPSRHDPHDRFSEHGHDPPVANKDNQDKCQHRTGRDLPVRGIFVIIRN